MIKIDDLKQSDIGRWVKRISPSGKIEEGRLKGWGTNFVFVVYLCDDQWGNYRDYTACATAPIELTFKNKEKVDMEFCAMCATNLTSDKPKYRLHMLVEINNKEYDNMEEKVLWEICASMKLYAMFGTSMLNYITQLPSVPEEEKKVTMESILDDISTPTKVIETAEGKLGMDDGCTCTEKCEGKEHGDE